MSNGWIARVYFAQEITWPVQRVESVLQRLGDAKLVFHKDESDMDEVWWFSLDGLEAKPIATLDEALSLTTQNLGGLIPLFNFESSMIVKVGFSLCANPLYPATSADHIYGSIGLFVNYAYLWGDPPPLIQRRYQLIFRWLKVISETNGAIYGWGDTEYGIMDAQDAVRAADLAQWNIPRLSWWSFYSKEYLQHLGVHRLGSAAVFLSEEDDYGLTTITFPPGEPAYSTMAETKAWYS